MRPAIRRMALSLCAVAVVAFGTASVASFRPSGVTHRSLAVASLKRALATLDDEALDSMRRVAAYRAGLNETDLLLRQALRSNPADTASIERLAMVHWELAVLGGPPETQNVSLLVDIAATRAPRVPAIQADLGSLLYRMGRVTDAARFMKLAVELSPAITPRVVARMSDAGLDYTTIASVLPRTVQLLVALRQYVDRTGDPSVWLAYVEEMLPEYPAELLPPYSETCVRAKSAERLLIHAERLGVLRDDDTEAKRQLAIGRAHVALHSLTLAASAAARARSLCPTNAAILDTAGQLALESGDPAGAEVAFRDALGSLAREGSRGTIRARLYRQHGQALERLGRIDDAFDDYRLALEISPADPWLQKRLATWAPHAKSEVHP